MFSFYDKEHWSKVYSERRRLGLRSHPEVGGSIEEHPLNGKVIKLTEFGLTRKYLVKKVYKDWYKGWFLMALLETVEGSSHRTVAIENIACHDESILDLIANFKSSLVRP